MKIILPFKKYIDSLIVEDKLVVKILSEDKYNRSLCIQIIDHFHIYKGETDYYAINLV